MRLALVLTALLCASTSCTSRAQVAPCPAGAAGVDATICRSSELRRLDRRLVERYGALVARAGGAEADALRDDQRQWLEERDRWCAARPGGADALARCVRDAYQNRLDDLDRLEACGAADPKVRPASCDLTGEWTVSGVKVGAGVQALQENDPLYMNKVFRANPARLEFASERCDVQTVERTLRSTRRWFEEEYQVSPSDFGWEDQPLGRSLVLRPRCRSGALGPAAAGGSQIILGRHGEMGLTYYDGALLILRRSR